MTTNQLGNTCGNNFSITTNSPGITRFLDVENTDATGNPNSTALIFARTQPGAGDAVAQFIIAGATSWSLGADNSDNDDFKISRSTALGTTDCIQIHAGGQVSEPLQPCFSAFTSVAYPNCTGNGTVFNFICDSTLCNGGGHYDTITGVFTAPVTGKYFFTTFCILTGLTPAFIQMHVGISLVAGAIYMENLVLGNGAQSMVTAGFSNVLQLNVGETVRPYVRGDGEAGDVCGIPVTPGVIQTGFSGYLIA